MIWEELKIYSGIKDSEIIILLPTLSSLFSGSNCLCKNAVLGIHRVLAVLILLATLEGQP